METITVFSFPLLEPTFLIIVDVAPQIRIELKNVCGQFTLNLSNIELEECRQFATGPAYIVNLFIKDLRRIIKGISNDTTIYDLNRKLLKMGPQRAFKSLRKLEKIRKKNFQPIF